MNRLVVVLSVLLAGFLNAHSQKPFFKTGNERGFVTLNAGPSFPLGDYGSFNIDKEQPGFAETGYNINLQLGYHLTPHYGFTTSAIYTRHGFDNSLFVSQASGDHWKYMGLLAGIIATLPVAEKASLDLNILTGIVRVNSPKIVYTGQEILSEDWTSTVPLNAQLDIRFKLARNLQVIGAINYLYMQPKFSVVANGNSMDVKQKMNVLGLNTGLGFGF